MDLNANELVVASFGTIHTAPVGTTLPATDPTSTLAAGFGYGLGYVTEDGVTFASPTAATAEPATTPSTASLTPVNASSCWR